MNPNPARKNVALPILFGFTMLPVLLLVVASTGKGGGQQGPSPISPAVLYGIEIIILLAGASYATRSLRPELPTQRFVQTMIFCLTASELASLLAFVFLVSLGGASMAPAVAGSVLVNVFFVAPRVLAFVKT